MNYIVSGDLHISVKKDLPLEWQLNRYRLLFRTYRDLCHLHNAELVLTGDLAHNAKPNLHESSLLLELFLFMEESKVVTHIIAGNHENMGAAGTTLDYFKPAIDNCSFVNYYAHIHIIRPDPQTAVAFVGHNKLNEWGADSWLAYKQPYTKVIFSHFRPTVNQFIKEEINVSKFLDTADIVFASDIHMPLDYSDKLIYTNAPVNTHFECRPNCGCLLVSVVSGKVSRSRLPIALPNLVAIETTVGNYEETLDDYNFYRIAVTGTPEELRTIKNSSPSTQLLKIPEVLEVYAEVEDAKEIREIPLEDALVEYMQELEYEEAHIQKLITIFREA